MRNNSYLLLQNGWRSQATRYWCIHSNKLALIAIDDAHPFTELSHFRCAFSELRKLKSDFPIYCFQNGFDIAVAQKGHFIYIFLKLHFVNLHFNNFAFLQTCIFANLHFVYIIKGTTYQTMAQHTQRRQFLYVDLKTTNLSLEW